MVSVVGAPDWQHLESRENVLFIECRTPLSILSVFFVELPYALP